MPKIWSDWDGKVKQVEHLLSKALNPKIKTGADSSREALTKGEIPSFNGVPRQPTDEEMFGHLVVTEEQEKKQQEAWENRMKDFFSSKSQQRIDHLNKSSVSEREWTSGKSFNDLLTEEEKKERALHISE